MRSAASSISCLERFVFAYMTMEFKQPTKIGDDSPASFGEEL